MDDHCDYPFICIVSIYPWYIYVCLVANLFFIFRYFYQVQLQFVFRYDIFICLTIFIFWYIFVYGRSIHMFDDIPILIYSYNMEYQNRNISSTLLKHVANNVSFNDCLGIIIANRIYPIRNPTFWLFKCENPTFHTRPIHGPFKGDWKIQHSLSKNKNCFNFK